MAALPQVTPPTVANLFAALEQKQRRDLHPRLSASQHDDCERKLWDAFRGLFPPEIFDGRKLSIFETGEVWEARLIERLKAAGIQVQEVDPATGEQWRVVFAAGHGSGRLDGILMNVPEAPKTEHVFEAKSHNDRSFKELLKKGVQEGKPAHYAQMQSYMHLLHLTRALYLAVNKNDDSLFAARIEYDAGEAIRLMTKAERIVTSDRRPACSCPSYFLKAGYGCSVNDGHMPARTCRSCMFSTAHLDGDARWSCERHKRDLCLDEQRAGCPQHAFNPTTVPGEQVDYDEVRERVTYRMNDGSVWVDGARS